MKAVIMAGGFGTRIHPLTINLPKPMIPLFNRPIMLHTIELLKKYGITELVLVLYYQPEVIKHYFGDGSEFGVQITYVTPLEDFGTAGAVKAAAKHLTERFMIISGDLLTDFDLSQAMAFHDEKKAVATLTLTRVQDPLQFGVVITDKEGRITKFLEKPGWGEVFSDTINTGIYILEPEVLNLIPEGENRDWSQDIFPLLLEQQRPLYGCNIDGYWQDIGNPAAYIEGCHDIFNRRIEVNFDQKMQNGDATLYTGNDCSISEESLEHISGMVVLGDNTQIQGKVRLHNSVVGRNCVIENGVQLENAILWDNVYVRANAKVSGGVCGHRVRLGEKVVVEEGAVLADDCKVGPKALIRQDVKVWPSKVIEGGSVVSSNLIWGEKWRKSLFEGHQVKGLTNIELTPEFVAKLGAAYGSILPKDSHVLIGRDACRSSRMLKRAFAGGILSTGVNVRDAKCVPLPMLRYKLTTFGEVGGVHFRQSEEDPNITEIVFFDGDSMAIGTNTAKTIERGFYKENFRRAHFSEPGGLSEMGALGRYYKESFLRHLDREAISAAAPKVVVDLNHSPASEVLPELLIALGCEVIELNSHIDETPRPHAPERKQRAVQQLSQIVVTLEAQAGFIIGPSGERLTLVDGKGKVMSHVETLTLISALMTQVETEGRLVMPTPAPHHIDALAAKKGVSVTRVKNDDRAIIDAARRDSHVLMAGTMDGRYIFPAFNACGDGMFATAKIVELLARSGTTLVELFRNLDWSDFRSIELPCPWEYKGGLMRRLSEDSADKDANFTDGVKILFDHGWVLVVPDAHRPVVHVVAEANTAQRAEEYIDLYRQKIDDWTRELREQ